jgi:hypothetical protein
VDHVQLRARYLREIYGGFRSKFCVLGTVGGQEYPGRERLAHFSHVASSAPRTTITGQWACRTTESETLPIIDRSRPWLSGLPLSPRPQRRSPRPDAPSCRMGFATSIPSRLPLQTRCRKQTLPLDPTLAGQRVALDTYSGLPVHQYDYCSSRVIWTGPTLPR